MLRHITSVLPLSDYTKWIRTLIFLPLIGLAALIYYPTLNWFNYRWFLPDSYYSHGPLIPLVFAYLVWRERSRLRATPIQSDRWGLALLFAGIVVELFSAWMRVHFSSGLSMLLVIYGLVWYLLGRGILRVLWFPLVFLSFMVPMPMDLIAVITFKLKMAVASTASWILNAVALENFREGSMVYLPNTQVSVDTPCSGLHSLISFVALGSLYGYLVSGPSGRRLLLLLCCIPLALLANLVRVVLILIIANRFGNAIITNTWIHEGFGFLVFAVGLVGFFLIARFLRLGNPLVRNPGSQENPSCPQPQEPRAGIRLAPSIASVALLSVLFLITAGAYSVDTDQEQHYTPRFPDVIGKWRSAKDLYAQMDDKPRKRLFEMLETEDTIYREYEDGSGNTVDLVVVYSAHNRKVAHPPEICFQGAGWQQQLRDTLPIPHGQPWGMEEVNRLVLDRQGAKQIALYWYKSGHQQLSSYFYQQVSYVVNSLLRRDRGSALIRLTTFTASAEGIPSSTKRLEDFARDLIPLVDTSLSQQAVSTD